jgi:hypothetical protein
MTYDDAALLLWAHIRAADCRGVCPPASGRREPHVDARRMGHC